MKSMIKSLGTLAALAALALTFASCEQAVDGEYAAAGLNSIYAAPSRSAGPGVGQPVNWTLSNDPPFMSTSQGTMSTVNGVAGISGTLVAVSGTTGIAGYAASSYDGGSTWATLPAPLPGFTRNPSVIHNLNGFYLATPGSNGTAGAYSQDGLTWSETGDIGYGVKAGVYGEGDYGAGTYVVAGQNGSASYATNLGSTFEIIPQYITGWVGPQSSAIYINAGAYGNGMYVFGGGSGRIAYTETIYSKGDPWEDATEPFDDSEFINVIAYGNEVFVAVGGLDGGPGRAAYSSDGITWNNARNFPLGNGVSVYALTYGDGYFVAGDDAGNIAYSVDGNIWTLAATNVFTDGTRINAIGFDGGTFAAVGGAGRPRVAYSIP